MEEEIVEINPLIENLQIADGIIEAKRCVRYLYNNKYIDFDLKNAITMSIIGVETKHNIYISEVFRNRGEKCHGDEPLEYKDEP